MWILLLISIAFGHESSYADEFVPEGTITAANTWRNVAGSAPNYRTMGAAAEHIEGAAVHVPTSSPPPLSALYSGLPESPNEFNPPDFTSPETQAIALQRHGTWFRKYRPPDPVHIAQERADKQVAKATEKAKKATMQAQAQARKGMQKMISDQLEKRMAAVRKKVRAEKAAK